VVTVSQGGQLDRRIVIRRATYAANAFNELVPVWTDYATVWARKHDVSAAEAYRAQEVGAELSARFTVRYSPVTATIDPRDIIAFGGRVYNITGVRDVERNRWREIDAVARAQDDEMLEADSPAPEGTDELIAWDDEGDWP